VDAVHWIETAKDAELASDESMPLINLRRADDNASNLGLWRWSSTAGKFTRDTGDTGDTGDGKRLAVVDTGLDTNASRVPAHADFASKIADRFDYTHDGHADTDGHGTHAAGIAVGQGNASNRVFVGAAPERKPRRPTLDRRQRHPPRGPVRRLLSRRHERLRERVSDRVGPAHQRVLRQPGPGLRRVRPRSRPHHGHRRREPRSRRERCDRQPGRGEERAHGGRDVQRQGWRGSRPGVGEQQPGSDERLASQAGPGRTRGPGERHVRAGQRELSEW
jgi:hypothetical protein